MIRIRPEGEPIRQGLNIYPFSDGYNKGFILKIGNRQFRWRYSVSQKKHLISFEKVNEIHYNDDEAFRKYLKTISLKDLNL